MWQQVHEVEGGDHSLKVKGGKEAVAAAVSAACKAAVAFVREVAGRGADDGAGDEQPAAAEKGEKEKGGHAQASKRRAGHDPRSLPAAKIKRARKSALG